MKKVFSLILCGVLVLGITGCGNNETTTDKNSDNSNNNIQENSNITEMTTKSNSYEQYVFGDFLKIKASADTIISGNVIENGEDYVVILQSDKNDNPTVTWGNVEKEVAVLKSKWTNVTDVRLMSIDVLLNNLTLSDNDVGDGYNGHKKDEDSFLYSFDGVQSYWIADSSNAKAKCYEAAGCAWAVFNPYVTKVTVKNSINLRPAVEVSKEYIVE